MRMVQSQKADLKEKGARREYPFFFPLLRITSSQILPSAENDTVPSERDIRRSYEQAGPERRAGPPWSRPQLFPWHREKELRPPATAATAGTH